jgi:hypothetical protein
MVFDIARRQGPQELEELGPYAGGSIEDERQ